MMWIMEGWSDLNKEASMIQDNFRLVNEFKLNSRGTRQKRQEVHLA